MTYIEIQKHLENIAKDLDTMFEAKHYEQYGYSTYSFMTDKFGGTYVHFHCDHKTGVLTDWYGLKKHEKVVPIEMAMVYVSKKLKEMLKARNLDEIYAQINAEY